MRPLLRALLLTAVLLVGLGLSSPAAALTQVYDSDAAAWLNAAAHWPGAGPIFDASDLVIATYSTWVVTESSQETRDIDAVYFGQEVCSGDAPYCLESYVRGCCVGGSPSHEAATLRWHLVFGQPVLGVLFDGYVYSVETNEFALVANRVGSSQQRTDQGLPASPTSFGFLTDHLVYQLDGRQNHDGEGIVECCPVPLFAIGPAAVTPIPEPGTWLLVGSGLVGLAGRWVRRRLSASAPRDAHPDPERL